jgi:hypothetical protein
MMPRKLFIASICLNIGLGASWALLAQRQPESAPAQDATALVTRSSTRPAATNRVDVVITNQLKTDFTWSQLESEDYKKYIENLRAVGCPELTIYDIIIAELDLTYEPKLNILKGANLPMEDKFWLNNKPKPPRAANANEEIKKLEEERRNLIKDLLGLTEKSWRVAHNYYEDSGQTRYAYLTEEQRLKLEKLEYNYEKLGGAQRQGTNYPNENVRKKMLAEMKTFMSPEEIFEYEVRTSNLSRELRNSLKAASPSEEEFRKIFTTTYEARNLGPEAKPGEGQTKEQFTEALQRMNETMKQTLGEERYTEVQRMKDPAYRQLVSAAPYLGFDKSAAVRIQAMEADVEKAVRTLNANQALSPEQRTKALQDIRVATEKAVQSELGEKGTKYYLKGPGYWLRRIGN